MKKLLITTVLIASMLSVFGCSDNNTPIEENVTPTTTEAATTAEPTTKPQKEYNYVHGTDGYYNIADNMPNFETKSQKYGTCWLYAAAASMETSYFNKNGSYISIDPMHLLDIIYIDDKDEGIILDDGIDAKELGGSQWIVTEKLSGGFDGLTLDSSVILDVNDREAIKKNIRTRGGVAVGIYDASNKKKGWFGKYYTINYDNDDEFDHDVTIIGYDDHFPKEYFKDPASEDGAWITYNSNLGSAGYYYISYCSPLEYAFSHSVTDKYGEVISYDAGNYLTYPLEYAKSHPLADNYSELLSYYENSEQNTYIKTGEWTKTANVFHKSGKLAAVGTYNDFDKQKIKIEIYSADFKELKYSQEAVLDHHGYQTVDLDKPFDVSDYAVAISYEKGAPVEGESIDGNIIDAPMNYVTVSEKGQSFVYIADTWKDTTDSDIKKALNIGFEPNNCCIKALYAK